MRISLSKDTSDNKSSEIRVSVKVSAPDNPQAELVDSHFFNLQEYEKQRLIAVEVFTKKPLSRKLRNYGKMLYRALFSENTSSRAQQLLQEISPPNPTGRILLELNGHQDLDDIPWEYAWTGKGYLIHQCLFARVHKRKEFLLLKLPLRIVAVSPDPVIPPDDPNVNLPDLYLSDQFQNFINGFYAESKKVILERVFPPTVDQMDALLMNTTEAATVLHFMGHCGAIGSTRALIFEHNDTGKHEFVDTLRLVSMPRNLRLAFLSACNTREIARALSEQGVAYTIGSYCSLPDTIARKFETRFYQLLARGCSVEMAMWRARLSFLDDTNIRQYDYFSGAMILYSTFQEDDGAFKCEEGLPMVKLYMPPNNLESIPPTPMFLGRKKELIELDSVWRRMATRGIESCHVYTITGIGGQGKTALAMETVKRMAHLFPGGIFAWPFDRETMSISRFFLRLIKVIFPDNVQSRILSDGDNIRLLGPAIVREFVAYPTCLLILDHVDTLRRAEALGDEEALALGKWLREVAPISNMVVKIFATSNEPLGWEGEKTMHLNGLLNSDITHGVELLLKNVANDVREQMEKETNATQLLQDLVRFVDGHPLCLQSLGHAITLPQYHNASLEELIRNHCSTMLADGSHGSRNLKIRFQPTIDELPTQQRLLLYMCSLFTGPITKGVLEFVSYFVENVGSSEEKIDSSSEAIVQNLHRLCDRGLLSKMDEEYKLQVALREGTKQCNTELKLRLLLQTTGVYDNIFIIGVIGHSEYAVKWPFHKFEVNAGSEVMNKDCGIQYFSIRNGGSHIIDISGTNNHNVDKTAVQQTPFIRLVVFICKASETLCNDFHLFCIDQIIPIVNQKKLPFILCLEHANDSSTKTSKTVLDQMKKTVEMLRASLRTHWIIKTDVPFHELKPRAAPSTAHTTMVTPLPSTPETLFDLPELQNDRFVGREDVFGKLQNLLDTTEIGLCRRVALTGLGGIGKTQIALEYCYRNLGKYRYIFWMRADSETEINTCFGKVAKLLNLPVNYTDKPEVVLGVVNQWLQNQMNKRWLLVFDNVDDSQIPGKHYSGFILKYFPKLGNGDIIVTTRDSIANHRAHTLDLNEIKLDADSAKKLLLRSSKTSPFDDSIAQEIVEELGYLPLAIDLAGACMEHNELTAAEFLKNYKAHQRDYLDLEYVRKATGNQYAHTVLTVWEMAFERIEKKNPIAVSFLHALAFLHPDDIPIALFKKHSKSILSLESSQSEVQPQSLDRAIIDLRAFSLIQRTGQFLSAHDEDDGLKDTLSIHRLVQTIIILGIKDEEKPLWCQRLITALDVEVGGPVSDFYDLRLQRSMEVYLLHVRHIALQFTHAGSKEFISLLLPTVQYMTSRGIFERTEDLAKLAISCSVRVNGVRHQVTSTATNNLALVYEKQGNLIDAEQLYRQALSIDEELLEPNHANIAIRLNNLALVYSAQNKFEDAELMLQRALAILTPNLTINTPNKLNRATFLNSLGCVYLHQGKFSDAEEQFLRVVAIREKHLRLKHPSIAVSLENLASAIHLQYRFKEAEILYRRAFEINEEVLGPKDPKTILSMGSLAGCYVELGKFNDAELLFIRTLAVAEEVLGPKHPRTILRISNKAVLHILQAKFNDAKLLLVRALAIAEEVLGPHHPDTALYVNNLARCYHKQGDLDRAKPLYIRALATRTQVLGPEHKDTIKSLNDLASLYRDKRMFKDAEPMLIFAVKIREKVLGPHHPDTATSVNDLALLRQSQGKFDVAEQLFTRALEIRKNALRPNHPDTATSANDLGVLYQSQGHFQNAALLFKEALEARIKSLGSDHPDTVISANNLVSLNQNKGKPDNELGVSEISGDTSGTDDPDTSILIKNPTSSNHTQSKSGNELLISEIYEETSRTEDPDTVISTNNPTSTNQTQDTSDSAQPTYGRLQMLRQRILRVKPFRR